MTNDDMRYVRYIVDRYLSLHPAFVPLRDDLISIGSMAYVNEREKYDSTRSDTPFLVHMRIRVTYKLGQYIRDKNPMKHWARAPTDIESPYWDTEEIPDVTELPDMKEDTIGQLKELMIGVPLTDNQSTVVRMFLEGRTFKEIANELEVKPQTAHETLELAIRKIRKANGLE